ncbi:MAG TPA: hypothetical protein VF183_07965, partial [Acidimicrobiales bacterium]
MDVAATLQRARGDMHPLLDRDFCAALDQAIPASLVSFNDLRPDQRTDEEFELTCQAEIPDWPFDAFWD